MLVKVASAIELEVGVYIVLEIVIVYSKCSLKKAGTPMGTKTALYAIQLVRVIRFIFHH